jgi:hypothetical protein
MSYRRLWSTCTLLHFESEDDGNFRRRPYHLVLYFEEEELLRFELVHSAVQVLVLMLVVYAELPYEYLLISDIVVEVPN